MGAAIAPPTSLLEDTGPPEPDNMGNNLLFLSCYMPCVKFPLNAGMTACSLPFMQFHKYIRTELKLL